MNVSYSRRGAARWMSGMLVVLTTGVYAAEPSGEDLQRQLESLRRNVESLQQQLKRQEQAPAVQEPAEAEYATKDDISGLRADLEDYKYQKQREWERNTAQTKRGTAIGGTIAVRYTYNTPTVTSGSITPADGRYSSFDVASGSLNFTGSLYRDYTEGRNLDYRLAFAYAKTSPVSASSNFNATDAYLVYALFPTVTGLESPKLSLTFGQQQVPFGLEAQVGEELRPVINSAQFLSGLGNIGSRQIGLVLRGDLAPTVDYGFNYRAPLLEYALGVLNGDGPNTSDDNNQKDWIGRVAFTLPVDFNSPFRELKFGVSRYEGRKNLNRTVPSAAVVRQGHSDRTGFDIYYNHDPFGVTYEYAQGLDEAVSTTGAAQADVKSRGQYLTLFYTWGEQWVKGYRAQAKFDDWWPKSYQAFVRRDEFNPDVSQAAKEIDVTTVGLNVFFAETTKFQVNVNRTEFKDPAIKTAHALQAQFQFGF